MEKHIKRLIFNIKMVKNKVFVAAIGIILAIIGVIGAVAFAVNNMLVGIIITGLMVIAGVLIIAYTLGDMNEIYY